LVGIYLNIFSAIILSTIKQKKIENEIGGKCCHFFSKISTLKYFFEALIAKL